MPRHHVAVALLLPQPAARDVDVLRAALGARDRDRVPPHLTLVPPCSVRADDLPGALAVLREAAAASRPLALVLGPVTTFSPVTPTVHLAVADRDAAEGGDRDAGADDLVELHRLHAATTRGPFGRPVRHDFVPHVTLLEQAPLHRIGAARLALAQVEIPVRLDRLTLLREVTDPGRDGPPERRWEPLADVDLDGVHTIGRGGLPIELSRGTVLDPEARAALELSGDLPGVAHPAGPVIVARLDGAVVGAAWGAKPGQRRISGPVDGDVLTAAWLQAHAAAD